VRKLLVLIVGLGLVAGACASEGGSTSSSTSTRPKPAATAAAVDPASVPKAPSAGCTGATPAPAGETKQTTTVDGAERWWFRHVPPAHDGRTPVPLVVDLHGYTEGATIHEGTSGLGPFGDQQGFVTVTPQGQGDVAHWDTALGSTDLTFFGKALDATEQQLCIDRNRVYTTGYSNGAFMTSAVACQFSDRIAAVAPVAGARIVKGCTPARAVPVVAFHGTADGYVSYDGGLGKEALKLPASDGSGKTLGDTLSSDQLSKSVAESKSVPEIMAAWAKRNGCAPGDTETRIAADVTRFTYDCSPADAAVLYRVTGGGHAWPGSPGSAALVGIVGPTTMNIDANEIMWRFFVAHPLTSTK
jgi:polyhydroxybutyrate depolymerase